MNKNVFECGKKLKKMTKLAYFDRSKLKQIDYYYQITEIFVLKMAIDVDKTFFVTKKLNFRKIQIFYAIPPLETVEPYPSHISEKVGYLVLFEDSSFTLASMVRSFLIDILSYFSA